MRRSWVIVVCAAGLLAPGSALAAGGPVPPVQGGAGVAAPGSGPDSYVAVAAGRDTLLRQVSPDGAVVRTRTLSGRWGVPGAAYDGSTTGLSADGRTLVLAAITERYPPSSTRLLVVDTPSLAVSRRVALPGFLAVDAISPDGGRVYVLSYPKPRSDLLRYDVLAYDVQSGRLDTRPIMDPREPDEKMGGIPVARAMSTDGRWAYTLYTGDHNFVHALDTQAGTARCIDLPAGDFSSAKLRLDGTTLHAGAAATIDLRTFALAKASPSPAATPRATATPKTASAKPDSGGIAWPPVVLGLVVLCAVGLLAYRVRARRPEPLEVSLQHHVDADHTHEKAAR